MLKERIEFSAIITKWAMIRIKVHQIQGDPEHDKARTGTFESHSTLELR
ncbi:UNVERIFIED_CONTAM: hypothetical protein ABIC26_002477 [Paenibacillus sp. PvR008]